MTKIFALFLINCLIAVPQSRVARVGDIAPPLRLGTIVQGASDFQKPGRAKLIEFWAASCPSCVANIAHLNQLIRQFQDRPIDFASINAFETEDVIRRFIAVHAISGVVAEDGKPGTTEAFGIESLPVCVLLSKDGRVAAIGNPADITPAVLEQLLSGQPVFLQPPEYSYTMAIPKRHTFINQAISEDSALVKLILTPTVDQGALVMGPTQLESAGANLRSILAYAFDVPSFHVILPEIVAEERFAAQIWVPEDAPQLLKPLVQAAIGAAANIKMRMEHRQMDVLILNGFPGKLVRVPESRLSPSECQANRIMGDAMTWENFRGCLENVIGKTIISPGVTGNFRVNLTWHAGQADAFQSALNDQLGMQLVAAKRDVNVLVVEPTGHPN